MTTEHDTFLALSEHKYRMLVDLDIDKSDIDEALEYLHTTLPEDRQDILPGGYILISNMTIQEVLSEAFCLGASCERINNELGITDSIGVSIERQY